MFGREFIGQLAECLRALQVDAWHSGEVEEDELRQCRLSAYAIENRLADILHIEIHETGFRPKNQRAGNQFIIQMPFAIRKTTSSLDASEERNVGAGGGSQ